MKTTTQARHDARPDAADSWRAQRAGSQEGGLSAAVPERAAPPPTGGLVICPITRRQLRPPDVGAGQGTIPDLTVPSIWGALFPTKQGVLGAAATLPGSPWQGEEGPVHRLVVSPGVIVLERPDLGKRERALERAEADRAHRVADLAVRLNSEAEFGELDAGASGERRIWEWSRKSRARMVRTLADLDYSPMLGAGQIPAMVTLTYPGDWLSVAPNGATVKKHVDQLRKRWVRAWGTPPIGTWKLEFQRRGAPHLHFFLVPPQGRAGAGRRAEFESRKAANPRAQFRQMVGDNELFRPWLSKIWADIVAHPDPVDRVNHELAGTNVSLGDGLKCSDPKRLAIYFSKHGSYSAKEYQNRAPAEWIDSGESIGRFWGYWGLRPLRAGVEITPDDYHKTARVLRKLGARHSFWNPETQKTEWRKALRKKRVERVEMATGRIRYRTTTVPVRRLAVGAGFVCVNDGPGVARQLAAYLRL